MTSSVRPALVVLIAGTGTEVGKTWVASQLALELRRLGLRVAARKPAQSFEPGLGELSDADLLAAATGETASEVCPPWRWYPKAMAPPMAAESMGLGPFTLQEIVGELSWPPACDVGIVEQAGGIGSPQASDGDGLEMIERLAPERVVVVAPPGLGTLSSVSLVARALGARPFVVYLNHFNPKDELHSANLAWLRQRLGLVVEVSVSALAGAFCNAGGLPTGVEPKSQ